MGKFLDNFESWFPKLCKKNIVPYSLVLLIIGAIYF